ncbi:WbqC family protein [Ureibacillus sp. MALMAid1270]|uniref:WbqC family protein n=1 Tax=Ureibacillus sp. MALMAid1270 TaxID=3411629 RepID=UPI003BA6B8AA
MKVSIHQPNYLPWIGYFNKLDQSNCFVFLDKADVLKGSVLNRNYILYPNGKTLLTVPLKKRRESDSSSSNP